MKFILVICGLLSFTALVFVIIIMAEHDMREACEMSGGKYIRAKDITLCLDPKAVIEPKK